MNDILENVPPISSFPNDEKLRVVWAHAALLKNTNGTTNVPNAEIMLKEISPDGSLDETPIFINVAVSELDVVRYMTIWKGNRRIDKMWDDFKGYKQNLGFNFDFGEQKPETIKFGDKRDDTGHRYFPPFKYKLGNIVNKASLIHCLNSRFTKLTTPSGTTVLIPSLEFFTSTYAPQEKGIRNKLLQYPLEKVLNDYIKEAKIIDDEYHVEFYEKKIETNEAFLAYAKFNQATRRRLQSLRSSVETSSNFTDRYPVVLPYHPKKLNIVADGIWLDKETFFAFRVNGYSLPTEHKIISIIKEYENKPKPPDDKSDKPHYRRYPQEIDDNDIPAGNNTQPHARNGSKHIISEVRVLNIDRCNIEHERKIIETQNTQQTDYENTEDIDELSSAEPSNSEGAKKTGKMIVVPKKDDVSHLAQSDVLKMVKEALIYMRDTKINIAQKDTATTYIKEILFVDENCNLSNNQMSTQFSRVLKSVGIKTNTWTKYKEQVNHKIEFKGYRNYMLIKIVLNNGKFAYLFEIDRKNDNESFLGLVFNLQGAEAEDVNLKNLLNSVMDKTGKYVEGSMGLNNFRTFKHYVKDERMVMNVKNNLARANSEGLFI